MIKKLLYLIAVYALFGIQFMNAQSSSSEYLVRSTIGVSGSSVNLNLNNKAYLIEQSFGQASVIGTFSSDKFTVRQGFIQSNVLAKIRDLEIPLILEAIVYPNPFAESITISFSERITDKVDVAVFDVLGRLVFSNSYMAEQKINLPINNLSVANYILKVTANNKQFVKKILKN